MCTNERQIYNKKYKPNKKNGGVPPIAKDGRLLYVNVPCGKCWECMKRKASQWRIRLEQEHKNNKNAIFVTLTLSDESLQKLDNNLGLEPNDIATIAVRRFLERHRKETSISIKHWLTTELGQNETERLHLHGILFNIEREQVEKHWKYGFTFIGEYVNNKTINYVTKYMLKQDKKHKDFKPKILSSPGIGKNWIYTYDSQKNKFKGKDTDQTYKLKNGAKIALPEYYRNKILTEEEREELRLIKENSKIKWVNGNKIDTRNVVALNNAMEWAKQISKKLGYE